jgi:hypothetical protein
MKNNTLTEQDLKSMLQKHSKIKSGNYLPKLIETHNSLRLKKSKKITFEESFIKYNNNPVIFPNTINLIQGQKGQHKSRLAEYFISVLLGKRKLLGFDTNKKDDYAVCLIDTERNLKEQLPYALQSILTKAGFEHNSNPDNFLYTSLLDVKRQGRFDALKEFIEYAQLTATESGKNLFIVLDVITDFINNFNDPTESLKLVDLINGLINTSNVTFLLVIHENPFQSSTKARGHLGTELTNKATTVIKVGIDNNYNNRPVKIEFIHNRLTKKLDDIHLEYCDEIKGFKISDTNVIINNRIKKYTIDDIFFDLMEKFKDNDSIKKSDYIKSGIEKFNMSTRTLHTKIKMIKERKLFIIENQNYNLIEDKNGKAIMLKLSPYFEELPE